MSQASLARWALIASVIAGVSYVANESFQLPMAAETVWKGAGVGGLMVPVVMPRLPASSGVPEVLASVSVSVRLRAVMLRCPRLSSWA